MKLKQAIARQLAQKDTDAAVDYYLREAGVDAALGFIDSLQKAYLHLGRHPLHSQRDIPAWLCKE